MVCNQKNIDCILRNLLESRQTPSNLNQLHPDLAKPSSVQPWALLHLQNMAEGTDTLIFLEAKLFYILGLNTQYP